MYKDFQFDQFIQKIKNNSSFIIGVVVISILYVMPIILANTYYVDDLNRTVAGYNWDHDGRFVSSKLMHLLSFQEEVVYSLYPFSTMLSAVILSLSGFIISYTLGVRKKSMLFIGSLLLTTCPFLLEILSYRFDCLFLSLSILFITFPFLFYQNKYYFAVISFLSIFFSFGLYQTTTLSYCIILCFFLIKDIWNDQFKKSIINLFIGILAFVFSFIGYKFFVKILDMKLLDDRRGDFIFKDENLKILLKERFYNMLDLVKLLITSSYRYVLYILIICSIISLIIYLKNNKEKLLNKSFIPKVILTIILFGFILLFVAGVNMFVYEQRWVPRAMIGWGVAIYVFYFALNLNKSKSNIMGFIAFTPFIYYSFLISSQLGMYLKNQDEFSDYIINLISPKLIQEERVKLVIRGTNKTTHRNITINHNTMPLIYKLAPIYENNEWGWGIIRLNKFDNISSEYIGGDKRNEILNNIQQYPIIDKNIYYVLRLKDGVAILDFDREF